MGPKAILHHGDAWEGWLLAQSFSSVPTRYNRACPMPLVLSIVNQFSDVQEFPFELTVEHFAMRIQPRPRRGLFERQKAQQTPVFGIRPTTYSKNGMGG